MHKNIFKPILTRMVYHHKHGKGATLIIAH